MTSRAYKIRKGSRGGGKKNLIIEVESKIGGTCHNDKPGL